MPAKPIPDRYHTITPYLVVEGATQVIEFMVRVFNGKVFERMARPDGEVARAEAFYKKKAEA